MTAFNIGDRVKVIDRTNGRFGKAGTVSNVGRYVYVDFDYGPECAFLPHELHRIAATSPDEQNIENAGGSDPINRPSHYTSGLPKGIEVIDIIEAQGHGFEISNVIKYVLRAKFKGNQIQDLKKARFYLDRFISRTETTP